MTIRSWLHGSLVTLGLALPVLALPALSLAAARSPAPITLARQGSFTAGGRVAGDPVKASIHCDHGFVEYQVPLRARKTALFFWHSASVQAWEQRWDGGEGYRDIFLRRGFSVYQWDGPRVGRANWGCEDYGYKVVADRDQQNFVAWRLGDASGQWFPGVQFPTADKDAWDQAMRGRYDEFDTPKNAALEAAAAAQAFEKIGPVVLVTNSAGGWRALQAALLSDKVKAIVAYEIPGFVYPEGEGPSGPAGPFGPTHVPLEQFRKLTRIPIQFVWGDNIAKSDRWRPQLAACRQYVELLNKYGGKAELLELPSIGLTGNTHLPFADLNNVAVADQLSAFLKRHGLDRR